MTPDQAFIESAAKRQQGRRLREVGQGLQRRHGLQPGTLVLFAHAVPQLHFETVTEGDVQAPSRPVHPQGDRGDRQQAVPGDVQPAGFHIEHHPALQPGAPGRARTVPGQEALPPRMGPLWQSAHRS
ncbi:hypothetical protein FQZ97_1079170 [compost metagenome]